VHDGGVLETQVVAEGAQLDASAGKGVGVLPDVFDRVARVAGEDAHRAVYLGVVHDVLVAFGA
jgi:hypothetical protein